MTSGTYDVFISYSNQDSEWVRGWLLPRLEGAGLSVCIDFRDFDIGVPSLVNMEQAVERSRKTLLVLTPDWVESEWANFEALMVQTDDPIGIRQRTLPLLLKKCKRPKRLAIFTYANFIKPGEQESQLTRILDAIRETPDADRTREKSAPGDISVALEHAADHTFPLQENFTGRVHERKMLTRWLAEDDHPVLALVAIGGMGKSSVAWVWLQRDLVGLPLPGIAADTAEVAKDCRVPEEERPDGVLWWSFYEGGGTFQGFLEAAIGYCSGGEKSAVDYLTAPGPAGPSMDYYAMQTDLIQLAQQHHFLLVWDGAERLLREYGVLDASTRQEREPEEMEDDARDTLEIPVSRFLQDMAGQASSRLLVVSRLYPRILAKLAGSRREDLTGLAEDDGVAYLRARAITGNRAELASAAAQYEFHPLSLSNLAADLLEDFEAEGDISGAVKHDQTENVKARQHHILARAYERRSPHRRELLSRLSAMRGTIPKEVVGLLAEDVAEMEPENLGRELSELMRHGLLRHPAPDRYDFHPLVRKYCYERLEYKEAIHLRLRDYFAAAPAPEADEVRSVEDLAPVIERYHHTVRAGRYDEAIRLFYAVLNEPLFYRLGAYQTFVELQSFVVSYGAGAPPLKDERIRGIVLNNIANCYGMVGQPRRAVALFEASNAMTERHGDKANQARGLSAVASLAYLPLGEVAGAERAVGRSIALSQEIRDEFAEAVGNQDLVKVAACTGQIRASKRAAGRALELAGRLRNRQIECVVRVHEARRALLMGKHSDALHAARKAWSLAQLDFPGIGKIETDIIRAEWLIGWALVALASESKSRRSERLAEAETHLTEALTRCRRINLVESEPNILLAWARWHRARENAQEARQHAEETLAIADRCEYRLVQADAHNFLARLALDDGDRKAAREHADVAKERAWCDGPPHCYKPALEEAQRLLAEVGSES